MAAIPTVLGLVSIQFKDCVGNDIDDNLLNALRKIIRQGIPGTHLLNSILVSSAFDSHENKPNSNHNKKAAVDISKINGKSILTHYGNDPEITHIVQRLQDEFEKIEGRRENFGPYIKKKCGKPYTVGGHLDHIHLSVNSNGQIC